MPACIGYLVLLDCMPFGTWYVLWLCLVEVLYYPWFLNHWFIACGRLWFTMDHSVAFERALCWKLSGGKLHTRAGGTWELYAILEGWGDPLFMQRNSNIYRQRKRNQRKQYGGQGKTNENKIAYLVDWLSNAMRDKLNRVSQARGAVNRHPGGMSPNDRLCPTLRGWRYISESPVSTPWLRCFFF